MKRFALIVLVAGMFFSVAKANDAGCGLGSLVIQKNTKLMQIFAATTNGTAGSQTFGITTGTSNCTADGMVMNEKEIQYFAEVNQTDLTREMSQGKGEKLTTLAALYGCKAQGKESFAKMTQGSFGKIVTSESVSSTELVNNLNQEVKSSGVCANNI